MTWYSIVLLVAAVGCGLMAGVFFAFSTFVMPGLARIDVERGIAAMQAINLAVMRSLFLAVFMGTALICVGLLVWVLIQWNSGLGLTVFAGSLAYLIGTFFVTASLNVPLNNRLAVADPATADSRALWQHYLRRWCLWNHIRTVFSLLAMVLFTLAYAAV